jgi:hypothetical protein
MPLRIQYHVLRGELDNRLRGRVRGKLWLHGRAEPVLLHLQGNACPDLAGCVLTFENTGETFAMRPEISFGPTQRGRVGDLTASRKLRVPERYKGPSDMPPDPNEPKPGQMANALFLEWYDEINGRVLIEGHQFKLSISAPVWQMSQEQEEQRQREAQAAFDHFIARLDAALQASKHQPPEDKEWDEFDYEKFMKECDARTDKCGELFDKYLDHPDREKIIAEAMGWTRRQAETEAEEQDAEEAALIGKTDTTPALGDEPFGGEAPDELEPLEPDPLTEGIDWVRDEFGGTCHPLTQRALNASGTLWDQCEALGLDKLEDDDLDKLVSEFQITGAKLAGALDGLAYGRSLSDGPFIVAYLKRALSHLHDAQAALEKVVAKTLLPADLIAAHRTELFAIRDEIVRLMQEFRERR